MLQQPTGKKEFSINVKPLQHIFALTNLNLPSILATDPGARLWMYIPGELFSRVRQQAPMPSPTPGSVRNKKYKEKCCYSPHIVLTQDTQVFVFPHPIWRPRLMYCFRVGLRYSQPGSRDQEWKSGLKISDTACFLRSTFERTNSAPGKFSVCFGNHLGLETLHKVWSGLKHKGLGEAIQQSSHLELLKEKKGAQKTPLMALLSFVKYLHGIHPSAKTHEERWEVISDSVTLQIFNPTFKNISKSLKQACLSHHKEYMH